MRRASGPTPAGVLRRGRGVHRRSLPTGPRPPTPQPPYSPIPIQGRATAMWRGAMGLRTGPLKSGGVGYQGRGQATNPQGGFRVHGSRLQHNTFAGYAPQCHNGCVKKSNIRRYMIVSWRVLEYLYYFILFHFSFFQFHIIASIFCFHFPFSSIYNCVSIIFLFDLLELFQENLFFLAFSLGFHIVYILRSLVASFAFFLPLFVLFFEGSFCAPPSALQA